MQSGTKDNTGYASSVWKCVLAPPVANQKNATITLTFDSDGTNAYVSMDAQDFNPSWMLYLGDGAKFIMQNDTLYCKEPDGTLLSDMGYTVTQLSANSIQLKYFGIVLDYANSITEYLFNRKN